jgi:hypothetical protein
VTSPIQVETIAKNAIRRSEKSERAVSTRMIECKLDPVGD